MLLDEQPGVAESVPVVPSALNARSAARPRRTAGPLGGALSRSEAASAAPQKGQASSVTRTCRAQETHGARCGLVIDDLPGCFKEGMKEGAGTRRGRARHWRRSRILVEAVLI